MSGRVVLAVDGGNSKTDLALVGEDGHVVALVRGPGCSPHRIGADACVQLVAELLERARASAPHELPRPEAAVLMMAGADLDSEQRELRERVVERDWADRVEIGNDTLALLRAGTDADFGIAVVCGAGINAIGLAPDGRRARFPALGAITGDWGGGGDLGLAALGKAVRAEDGRGRDTLLARLVPEHFSLASAEEAAFALHRRELDHERLVELAPLVLAAADAGDVPAAELRERLAAEIVAFVRAAAAKVLDGVEHFDVVLGGSLLSRSASLGRLVTARVGREVRGAQPRVCTVRPVAGAALIGLELFGAAPAAAGVVRSELQEPALERGPLGEDNGTAS